MDGAARGRGSDEREKMEGCSVFGSSLVLFKVQMTGYIRNLEFIPLKIGYQGSLKFSQPRADFAEKGHFRRGGPFSQPISQPISQLRNWVTVLRNGTRVPKGCFAAAKHPAK